MSQEGQLLDRKSLRAVSGKTADWGELVKDCVAFANATGGQLVRSVGRTQATRYFIDPELLRSLDFSTSTILKRIEPHRLLALIVEDVERYPFARISEIHPAHWRSLEQLVKEGTLHQDGVRSGTRSAIGQ